MTTCASGRGGALGLKLIFYFKKISFECEKRLFVGKNELMKEVLLHHSSSSQQQQQRGGDIYDDVVEGDINRSHNIKKSRRSNEHSLTNNKQLKISMILWREEHNHFDFLKITFKLYYDDDADDVNPIAQCSSKRSVNKSMD